MACRILRGSVEGTAANNAYVALPGTCKRNVLSLKRVLVKMEVFGKSR